MGPPDVVGERGVGAVVPPEGNGDGGARLLVPARRQGARSGATCIAHPAESRRTPCSRITSSTTSWTRSTGTTTSSNFVGYQPPFVTLDPDRLVTDEVVPENLTTAVVRESDFTQGTSPLELSRAARCCGRTTGPSSRRVSDERPRGSASPGGFLGELGAAGCRLARRLLRRPVLRDPCVALGTVDPILQTAGAGLEPARLELGRVPVRLRRDVLERMAYSAGCSLRTFGYVTIAVSLSLVIAYPVAYYVARYGGRFKGLLLARTDRSVLHQLPDADARVDQPPAGRRLGERRARSGPEILDEPRNWLDGRASSVILGMVYGYIPFMILPLYAFLDRIDRACSRRRATSARAGSRSFAW